MLEETDSLSYFPIKYFKLKVNFTGLCNKQDQLNESPKKTYITFGCFTWEMDPPWMKEGLSVGLVVGMSGGGEGMLAGRLGRLNVTRTPSGIPWTSWLETG